MGARLTLACVLLLGGLLGGRTTRPGESSSEGIEVLPPTMCMLRVMDGCPVVPRVSANNAAGPAAVRPAFDDSQGAPGRCAVWIPRLKARAATSALQLTCLWWAELKSLGATCKACSEKSDFAERVRQARTETPKGSTAGQRAGAPTARCVAKSSCKQGCDLCVAAPSQSKTVCRAISFCQWKEPKPDTKKASKREGGSKTKPAAPKSNAGSSGRTVGRSRGASQSPPSARSESAGSAGSGAGGRSNAGAAAMALFSKASTGDVAAVRQAVEQGLSVTVTDERGATPLHYASWYGHIETVEVLLAAGAHIDARSGDGFTPLHLAAAFGHTFVVSTLLARGADALTPDRDGNTAIELAQRGKFQGTVQILKDAQGSGVAAAELSRRRPNQEQCSTRYARLGLCAPDAQTQALLQVEEQEIARRAHERRQAEEELREQMRRDEFRRQEQSRAAEEEAFIRSQMGGGGRPPKEQDETSNRLVGHPSGIEPTKGMRVRKSQARLDYVRDNGWDDLSDGGDGQLVSFLGDGRQCIVRWDNDNEEEYAIGYGGLFDLQVA